jgi:hypothetical protein
VSIPFDGASLVRERSVVTPVFAVALTQWIIAIGSIGSALVALALALGLRDWVFRPRVRLVLRHASDPEEISDRIVTKRLENAEAAAFVRMRVVNLGRSTARNVCVSVLKVHRWDAPRAAWIRSRPELDGRSLQPSNQLAAQPVLVDVFPHSDRIVDLAAVDLGRASNGGARFAVEISRPWPPNEANLLEPGVWRVELLVCGDNIKPARSFVTLSFDGIRPQPETLAIWEHFLVHGPASELSQPPEEAARLNDARVTGQHQPGESAQLARSAPTEE